MTEQKIKPLTVLVSLGLVCLVAVNQGCLAREGAEEASHNYANAGVEMSDQAFNKKVKAFRDNVLNGRKSAVAAAVADDAHAYIGKKTINLHGQKDVLKYYDRIFTPALIKLIRADKTQDLFSRDQGVMLGGGEVWFNAEGKVITFNCS